MFERFTKRARTVVVTAQEQARALGHDQIGGEHLLLGILTQPESIGAKVLRQLGVDEAAVRAEVAALGRSDADALKAFGIDLDEVRRRAEEAFGSGALERPLERRGGWLFRGRGRHLRFNRDAKKLLERSLREALALRHNYIGTEHMILAIVADESTDGSTSKPGGAAGVLRRLGVAASHDDVRTRVLDELRRAA